MLSRLRPRTSHSTAVAYLALFVALGGGAVAATRYIGSDGQIHGCVDKKGHLALVKAKAKCGKGKSAIAWNRRGPRGLPGHTGRAGPTAGKSGGNANPPAETSTVGSMQSMTLTTTTAGALYVTGSLSTGANCAGPDDCFEHFGLYVDHNPVPGTRMEVGFPQGDGRHYQNVSMVGVVPGVAAGTHTVDLRWIDVSGSFLGAYDLNYKNVSGVLLGG